MIYALDIDGVICSVNEGRHYKYSLPNQDVIEKVNRLRKQGHIIKIFTARGAESGHNWYDYTEKQLLDWGLKYDELIMGKPHADIFVDDKAVELAHWLTENESILLMIVGERGVGKTTVRKLFERKGFSPLVNEEYYLKYGTMFPERRVNEDEDLQDKIYAEVETKLKRRLLQHSVIYEATGTNERWLKLKAQFEKDYIVKVIHVVANRENLVVCNDNYPSTEKHLASIRKKAEVIKGDFGIDNTLQDELPAQVEYILNDINGLQVVAVSGGFDPVHIGHIRYFKHSKTLGEKLVAIVQGDDFLFHKKGYVFMPLSERIEVLESIRYVDSVIVAVDRDYTVNRTLELLRPSVYAKGGDRKGKREEETCKKINCRKVTNVVPTFQSSSKLVETVVKTRGHLDR